VVRPLRKESVWHGADPGATLRWKRPLSRAIADGLHERIGVRTEDVIFTLIDVTKENWSFGLGDMQYAY